MDDLAAPFCGKAAVQPFQHQTGLDGDEAAAAGNACGDLREKALQATDHEIQPRTAFVLIIDSRKDRLHAVVRVDILTYDDENAETYESKELYIKEVSRFFKEGRIPARCTVRELIQGIFEASPEENKAVVLGYTNADGEMTIFSGDQDTTEVALNPEDKLIVFSNH